MMRITIIIKERNEGRQGFPVIAYIEAVGETSPDVVERGDKIFSAIDKLLTSMEIGNENKPGATKLSETEEEKEEEESI